MNEEHAALEETIAAEPFSEGSPLGEGSPPSPAASKTLVSTAAPAATEKAAKRPARKHGIVRAEREALRAELARLLGSTKEALSSEEIQARASVFSTEELRKALAWLVHEGRVERTGQARGTRYRWRGDPR